MLYASTSLSLACLELLVHLAPSQIPADYVYTSADLQNPPEIAGFRGDLKNEDATRRFGCTWATDVGSLAICVPSVIIPIEFNVLLNPIHAGCTDIVWSEPKPFEFDKRLLKAGVGVS